MARNEKQPENMIPHRFLIPLEEVNSQEHAGGKATNLVRVKAVGQRVPETIVVSRETLAAFVKESDLEETIRDYVRAFDTETNTVLTNQYKQICAKVHNATVSEPLQHEIILAADRLLRDAPGGLAVRSSAVMEDTRRASFAGVFESYLGCSIAEETMTQVRQVWCSLWAPKAIRYMKKMGIAPLVHGIDSMAVMIQKVVAARCSGVIYTADTTTGNPWRFILYATSGLSVDLMSISGVGDRLVLDSETGDVLEHEIDNKRIRLEAAGGTTQKTQIIGDDTRHPALSESVITSIAEVARSLDKDFGIRLDIEWALDNEGLVVIQARPLTGLPEFFPYVLSEEDTRKRWWASSFNGNPRPGVFNGNPQSEAEFIPPFFQDISGQEVWKRYHPKDMVFYADPDKEDKTINGYRFATTVKWRTFSDYVKGFEATEAWFLKNEESYRLRWRGFFADLDECASMMAEAIQTTTTSTELIPSLLWMRDKWADLLAQTAGPSQSFGWTCKELLDRFCRKNVSPEFNTDTLLAGSADSLTFRHTKSLQ
ncbi:MAG: PEP/pyruvate-binding domain-containing protein, partial [Chloroflexota bacterium]